MQEYVNFFSSDGFMPHGHCYLWTPVLLWQYVISDGLTALSYYSIPIALVYFVKKRPDIQFNWIFLMFSAFIFSCGTTHIMSIINIWKPYYWIDASLISITAIISIVTAIMLWKLMPSALSIPSTDLLSKAVNALEKEVSIRKNAEEALSKLNASLELRVIERTSALQKANEQLQFEIDSRKYIERALFAEKEQALVTLNSIADGVIVTDIQGKITYMNPVAEQMTEWKNEQALGVVANKIFNIFNEDTREVAIDPIQHVLKTHAICALANHTVLINREGMEYPIEDSAAPIKDADGQLKGVVLVFHDVSKARKMANRMSYLAQHDFLTDLPNRIMLTDRLINSIELASRHNRKGALIFVDLDHFKDINDTLGHLIGDALLQQVSERLLSSIRKSDTVSRQGGDEFIILLSEISDAEAVIEIVEKLLVTITVPYEIAHHELRISASMGITIFPEDGIDTDQLTKNADTAMYFAKAAGRNTYKFFTAEINEEVSSRVFIENGLKHAIEQGQFSVHYQPKFELNSGQTIGAEALLRWQHPTLGMVSPEKFIPLAEKTGLIGSIGSWVVREVCKQLNIWKQQGFTLQPIAINVSAVQLKQLYLLTDISSIISHSGLSPSLIEFEITESLALQGEKEAINWLNDLKAMGVTVAIDDFGTGYSSLSYLKRFPIDIVKIDRSFIRDITTDPDDAAIIQAIIKMSHSLRFTVLAEGIETQEQLDFLRQEGCDLGQGYLFSKPVPAHEFENFLQKS